jgi:hypothetical protein
VSNRLFVRTRSDGSTSARTDLIFPNGDESSVLPVLGAVSGDGCTVAYSVVVPALKAQGVTANAAATTATTELRIVDRCGPAGTAPQQSVLDLLKTESSLPAPALSIDGSSIAWPIDDEVRVYSAESTSATPAFVSVRSGVADDVVGARLDVSADGLSLVFESGKAAEAGEPGDPVLTNVYFSTLPGENDPAATNPIVRLLAPSRLGSSGPTISADGALVVYESAVQGLFTDSPAGGPYLVLANRSAEIADPMSGAITQRVLVTGAIDAHLSTNGTTVVYNASGSVRVLRSNSDAPFENSTEIIVNSALSSPSGAAVGSALSVPVISGNGTLAVFDQAAGVDLTADASFAADGHIGAVDTSTIFDPLPMPTTPTTTSVSTVLVSTQPLFRNPVNPTTRTTTRPTVVTTGVGVSLPVFEPATFEFAPTIVAAGRRTAEVDLVNSGTEPITIASLKVQRAEPGFAVDATTCEGQISAGQQCAVTVSFAPLISGEGTAHLVATLTDGRVITAVLSGIGAPAPLLSVLPGVAANGQVVTVFGGGFPAGAIVEFSWNQGQVKSDITVDGVGAFAETLVVFPNTAAGLVDVVVAGQTNLFGEVSVSVLVTDHGGSGSTAIFVGGFGP